MFKKILQKRLNTLTTRSAHHHRILNKWLTRLLKTTNSVIK